MNVSSEVQGARAIPPSRCVPGRVIYLAVTLMSLVLRPASEGADAPAQENVQVPVYTRAQMEEDLDNLTVRLKRAWAYADDKQTLLGVNLDFLQADARRELDTVRDADDFYFVVKRYVGGLMDGHAGVRPGHTSAALLTPAWWPFAVTRLDGCFYVKALEGDCGSLRPGDQVLKVNGVGVDAQFKTVLARSTGSTPAGREYRALDRMRGGKDHQLRVEVVRGAGTNLVCEMTALSGDQPPEAIQHRKLEGNVGYLRFPSFAQDNKIWDEGGRTPEALQKALEGKKNAVRAALGELKDTRALILDLRGNQGGSDALGHFLAHCFCDTKVFPSYYSLRTRFSDDLLALPGFSGGKNPAAVTNQERSRIMLLPEKDISRYPGKLAVLMDEGCFSACDCFLNYLKAAAPKTLFVGRPNGAGAGAPRPVVTLPHSKMVVTFCVMQVWNLKDQLIESRPIQPTVPVKWTVDDLVQGRDPDLTAALERLR